MKKFNNYILLLLFCSCSSIIFSQITYVQEFNGCSGQTCEKWKLSGGLVQISATPILGSQPITPNNPAALGNVNKFHSVSLNTTSALGISNGQPATFGFTYKCINYHSGETSPALSIAFDVYWAASQVGPWYLLESFMNSSNHNSAGIKQVCPTFTPALGAPVFIKIQATMNTQNSDFVDSWVVIDDVVLDQPEKDLNAVTAAKSVAHEQIEANFCEKDQSILLEWATSASHYAYFSIERATAHSDFRAIGKICGGKPKNELQSYVFVDQKPVLGKQYFYRVKMVDFYEHFIYSQVVKIRVDKSVRKAKLLRQFPIEANYSSQASE
ncbi:hypothetical protein [Haliscomenobacter sp.]|uniref:hypothetical protein n=1 Tax=Haliscomenobacter sp. TaxID=2717303 RepID=UPI0033651D5A